MEGLSKGRLVTVLFCAVTLRASCVRIIHGCQHARLFVQDVMAETTTFLFQCIHVQTMGKGNGRSLELPEDFLVAQYVVVFLGQDRTSCAEKEELQSHDPKKEAQVLPFHLTPHCSVLQALFKG